MSDPAEEFHLGKRTLLDSLSTFETKLNQALEQNALLENELDDKKQVCIVVIGNRRSMLKCF